MKFDVGSEAHKFSENFFTGSLAKDTNETNFAEFAERSVYFWSQVLRLTNQKLIVVGVYHKFIRAEPPPRLQGKLQIGTGHQFWMNGGQYE